MTSPDLILMSYTSHNGTMADLLPNPAKSKQLHGIDAQEKAPVVVLVCSIVSIDSSVYLSSELVAALCVRGWIGS